MKAWAPLVLLAYARAAVAGVEVEPRLGAEFEHFGETYRVTTDRDTVAVVDDYGAVAAISIRSAGRPPTGFEIELEGYEGYSTRRARTRLEGRWKTPSNRFELSQEASYRLFTEGGDYAVSGDHLEERLVATFERRLGGPWSMLLRHTFDGTWYESPTEYNLTWWRNEPRAEMRLQIGEWSRLRAGYRFAKREVPDSTSLGYGRHGVEAELSWLGEESAVDVAVLLQRREYDPASVRSSSWENRADARLELSLGDRATGRLLHEDEVIRYDDPDELDYDSVWGRSGLQLELRVRDGIHVSVMPVHAFLVSDTSSLEEYAEIGVELGVEWIGRFGWIGVTNEVGRRNYEVNAPEQEPDLSITDAAGGAEYAYSDYTYDRLTILLGAGRPSGLAFDLFVHWQPEAHDVRRHDSDTQIVSGGVTYRF